MSYPPPPGLQKPSSTPAHPSLPPRPPPSTYKPSFPQNGRGGPSSFSGFAPRSVAPPQPSYNSNNYSQSSYQPQQQPYSQYPSNAQQEPVYGAAPQIRNPFAPPGSASANSSYEEDPEMAAQIAQWQSAYSAPPASNGGYTGIVRKYPISDSSGAGTSANAAPLGSGRTDSSMSSTQMNNAAHNDTGVATVISDAKTNTKTVVRTGGGTTWTDPSLLEWDPAHFRIFVGNLAGEVTDESLLKAFSRWPSAHKAKVIRDKRTTKSKGFGFVSFTDGDDYFQAARDMQGKYIGSHPVLIRRSTTEIKAVGAKDKGAKFRNKGKGGKGGKGREDLDKTGAGVQKAGSKTKGGLKVLG